MSPETLDLTGHIIDGIVPPVVVGIVYWLLHRKLNEIHHVVNSRLDKALATIEDLKRQLGNPPQ